MTELEGLGTYNGLMTSSYWLLGIGFLVGTFGTMIGAGGGFILMPIFFFLYPHTPPEQLTAVSLSVVFFNALSGSAAYAWNGRIDYRSGILFSLATIPGAMIGAVTTSLVPRKTFDPIFAVALVAAGIYLIVHSYSSVKPESSIRQSKYPVRTLRERNGTVHSISYHLPLGIALSIAVGFFSSFLGIGGGIIHVPVLVHLLHFPVHIATATSHFILAIMAFFGALVHVFKGDLAPGLNQVLYLAPSVALGAQAGALLSHRIPGKWIIRSLALALAFVGTRILFVAFVP